MIPLFVRTWGGPTGCGMLLHMWGLCPVLVSWVDAIPDDLGLTGNGSLLLLG